MHKKLITLLQRLDANEINKLEQFLQSPYFNENQQLIALFYFLKNHYPTFDEKHCSAEQAFAAVFPHQKMDKPKLNRLNSELFKLTEKFLVHEFVEKDKGKFQLQLLQIYQHLSLPKHFESTYQRLQKQQGKALEKDVEYYERQFWMEKTLANFQSQKDDRTGDINLQAMTNALDVYYLLQKLQHWSQMLNRQQIVKIQYDYALKEEIFAFLDASEWQHLPAIALYRQALLLKLHPSEYKHYARLKELVEEYGGQFNAFEMRAFYTYLENSVKHVFPIDEYYDELFELYSRQLEQGILGKQTPLHHSVFKNVVTVALALQKFDWAADFIEAHHSQIIPASFRQDAYLLNVANLHFAKKDYEQVLDLLLESNSSDVYYKLGEKLLLAKSYFELKELEVLENFLNSFTKYIFDQKDKIAANKVASYRLFINFLRKLIKILMAEIDTYQAFIGDMHIIHKKSKQDLKRWKKQVNAASVFYGQQWLGQIVGGLRF
ncbi:MAG: hypothetical protein R3E32_04280 [Chitinophagales bacterium]